MAVSLTDAELLDLFDVHLPELLERRPDLEPCIYRAFIKAFATKKDVASVLAELWQAQALREAGFEVIEPEEEVAED